MIIEIPDDNSIVKWKKNDKEDWKSAEVSDLIKAYKERPQGGLISREALKEEIVKLCERINANNGITVPTLAFTRIIDNAPTVPQVTVFAENADEKAVADLKAELQDVLESRPQDKWIPVTERLPERNKEVIVTDIETEDTYCSWYHGNGYWECDNGVLKNRIIAWQPLPEPYKEGGAE